MTTSHRRQRRGGGPPVGVVVVVALAVALAGCEMLGLDSGGGPGSGGGSSPGGSKKGGGSSAGGGTDAGTPAAPSSDDEDAGADEQGPSLAPSGSSAEESEGPARNPFAPKVDLEEDDEDDEESNEPEKDLGPLKSAPLEEYRLIGIISGVAVPKAMFVDPNGKGHLVKEGQAIGSEGGTVDDIRENTVVIRVPKEAGGQKTVRLELRDRRVSGGEESGLSPREQETLNELMDSEQGRKALRRSLKKKQSPSGGESNRRNRGGTEGRAPRQGGGERAPSGESPR